MKQFMNNLLLSCFFGGLRLCTTRAKCTVRAFRLRHPPIFGPCAQWGREVRLKTAPTAHSVIHNSVSSRADRPRASRPSRPPLIMASRAPVSGECMGGDRGEGRPCHHAVYGKHGAMKNSNVRKPLCRCNATLESSCRNSTAHPEFRMFSCWGQATWKNSRAVL